MKRVQQVRLWLVALAGAVALAWVVPSTQADEKVIVEKRAGQTTYHYVYYPEAEIYMVPDTREYWINEGGRWRVVKEAPSGIKLGTSVTVEVEKPEPWTTHEVIVKKYGGKGRKSSSKETTKETIKTKDGDEEKTKTKETTKEKEDKD